MRGAYSIPFLAWTICLISMSKSDGVGRVFIGIPLHINASITQQTEYIFSMNNVNGLLPVYIAVFDGTDPSITLPITDNVAVSCELAYNSDGYSSGAFSQVNLGPSLNYSNIMISNLLAGRAIETRCYGQSQLPLPGLNATAQFVKETSLSDPILFQVKPSPTVNFCESILLVPDQYNRTESTFQLEFSEAVEGGIDNLNVQCNISSIAGNPAPELNIIINTTAAFTDDASTTTDPFVLLNVPYTILAKGLAISVVCSAESITGNQYQFPSSSGSPVQFDMETGSVTLYPEVAEFVQSTSPIFKTVLSLDSPVSEDDEQVSFLCRARVQNDSRSAISQAENPDCNFVYDTTTTTSTTLAPTTVANSTDNSTTAPVTPPSANLSLWEVTPGRVDFTIGTVFRSLEVVRTVDVDSTQLELILVTCCAPYQINQAPKYINQSVALLSTVYLQPPVTNWSLATDSEDAYVERTIFNPGYVEVAPCACDLTENACDVNCCCDQECNADQKLTFRQCIPGLVGGQGGPTPDHYCTSTYFYKDDWFPLMCVHYENNALLGLFFSTQAAARTVQSFYQKILTIDSAFTFRETGGRNAREDGVSATGYKHGQQVKTTQPTATGDTSSRSGVLSLPQRTLGGQCLTTAPVRFLVNTESDCTYRVTQDLCSANSVLSARMYAEAPGLTNPPCPRSYHVLSVEDSSGKTVSDAGVSYYCSPDNEGYMNTRSTFGGQSDPFSRSLFNYSLPDETCQDMFGNDVCADPEDVGDSKSTDYDLPPRCGFDDGYTPPPVPNYNAVSGVCENAVLGVRYNFTWSGQRITHLNVTVILGDLPLDVTWQEQRTVIYTDSNNVTQRNTTLVDRSAPVSVTQLHRVIFYHNYTSLSNTSTSSGSFDEPDDGQTFDRSGYPGYDAGKVMFSGKAIVSNTTGSFLYVNTNLSKQITLFDVGTDGLCFSAGRRRLSFRDDMMSSCTLRLAFQDLQDCTNLRKLILNRLNNLMAGDRVGRFGYSYPDNEGFWVEILRQNLTDYFDDQSGNITVPELPRNEFTLADSVTGVCPNVTTGIHLELLYGETGKTLGASILEIVGAKISYTLSTYQMSCMGSRSARCYGNSTVSSDMELDGDMLQSFYLTSSVRFIEVPAQIPVQPIRFWEVYNPDPCHFGSYWPCWPGLFYPLTEEYTGEPPHYTLAFTLVLVIALLFYFMITRPWW